MASPPRADRAVFIGKKTGKWGRIGVAKLKAMPYPLVCVEFWSLPSTIAPDILRPGHTSSPARMESRTRFQLADLSRANDCQQGLILCMSFDANCE